MIFPVFRKHFLVWQMPQLFSHHPTDPFLVGILSIMETAGHKNWETFKEGFLRGLSGEWGK